MRRGRSRAPSAPPVNARAQTAQYRCQRLLPQCGHEIRKGNHENVRRAVSQKEVGCRAGRKVDHEQSQSHARRATRNFLELFGRPAQLRCGREPRGAKESGTDSIPTATDRPPTRQSTAPLRSRPLPLSRCPTAHFPSVGTRSLSSIGVRARTNNGSTRSAGRHTTNRPGARGRYGGDGHRPERIAWAMASNCSGSA